MWIIRLSQTALASPLILIQTSHNFTVRFKNNCDRFSKAQSGTDIKVLFIRENGDLKMRKMPQLCIRPHKASVEPVIVCVHGALWKWLLSSFVWFTELISNTRDWLSLLKQLIVDNGVYICSLNLHPKG